MMVSTDPSPEVLLTTPCHGSTEELADLWSFLSARRTQQGKAREDDSVPGDNRTPEHDGDGDNGAGHSNSHNGLDKTSWIGVTIKAPVGERGQGTNAGGRLGFKTEDILKHAGITTAQWSQYLVCNILIPF